MCPNSQSRIRYQAIKIFIVEETTDTCIASLNLVSVREFNIKGQLYTIYNNT